MSWPRDSPVQRDGALRGETVFVDSRVGTPVADVSGATANLPQDITSKLNEHIPLGRWGVIEDVVAATVFLASDESRMLTGTTIAILDTGIGQAHIVDAQVARFAGRHLKLVPQTLLARDHDGSIALQCHQLRRLERGPRIYVRRGLVNDGR